MLFEKKAGVFEGSGKFLSSRTIGDMLSLTFSCCKGKLDIPGITPEAVLSELKIGYEYWIRYSVKMESDFQTILAISDEPFTTPANTTSAAIDDLLK